MNFPYYKKYRMFSLATVLFLVLFIGFMLYRALHTYMNYRSLETLLQHNAFLSQIYTQLTQERDVTANTVFSYTGYNERLKHLQPLYRKSDDTVDAWHAYLLRHTASDEEVARRHKELLNKLDRIDDIRYGLLRGKHTFASIFFGAYTTDLLDTILAAKRLIRRFYVGDTINTAVYRLTMLDKEYAKLLLDRGFFGYFLFTGRKPAAEEIARYRNARAKTEAVPLSTIFVLPGKELHDDIERTRRYLLYGAPHNDFKPPSYETWMQRFDDALNKVQKQQLRLYNDIKRHITDEKNFTLGLALFYLVLLLMGLSVLSLWRHALYELLTHLEKLGGSLYTSLRSLELIQEKPQAFFRRKRIAPFVNTLVEETVNAHFEAQQAQHSKKFFMTHISNEFLSPLNGIAGFAKILENTPLNEEQKKYLGILHQSAEELTLILKNTINYINIETGQVQPDSTLSEIIRKCEEAFAHMITFAQKNNMRFCLYIDPNIPQRLYVDATVLEDALTALLSFAMANHDKSVPFKAEILHRGEENLTHTLSFEIETALAHLTFAELEAIFESDTLKEVQHKGSMELRIAKELIAALGGTLLIEKVEEKSVRFSFTLTMQAKLSENEPHVPGVRIDKLLYYAPASEQDKNDAYIRRYLEFLGVEVTSIGDENALIEALEAQTILKPEDRFEQVWLSIDAHDPVCVSVIEKVGAQRVVTLTYGQIPAAACAYTLIKPAYLPDVVAALNVLPDAQTQQEASKRLEAIRYNATALIAEDSLANQKLLKKILEDRGFTVDVADNGKEALEKRQGRAYDIIFMDIQMPVMDGIEATQKILQYETTHHLPHTPIVILSGNLFSNTMAQLAHMGIDAYMSKPVQIPKLLSVLYTFLSHKTQREGGDTDTAPKKAKKILLAMNDIVERHITAKMLDKLEYPYVSIEQMGMLESELATQNYDILITDMTVDERYRTPELLILPNIPDILTLKEKITAFRKTEIVDA